MMEPTELTLLHVINQPLHCSDEEADRDPSRPLFCCCCCSCCSFSCSSYCNKYLCFCLEAKNDDHDDNFVCFVSVQRRRSVSEGIRSYFIGRRPRIEQLHLIPSARGAHANLSFISYLLLSSLGNSIPPLVECKT